MLGLLLIYFIGNYYYKLAGQYGKNEWAYGILGVVTYYAGVFIIGIALFLILDFSGVDVEGMNETALGFMAVPFGVLATFILYKYLERKFSRVEETSNDFLLDDNLNDL